MKLDNEEREVADAIKETADKLNELMEVADALGMVVSITPAKIERARGEPPLRQITARVSCEISITEDVRGDDLGNRR